VARSKRKKNVKSDQADKAVDPVVDGEDTTLESSETIDDKEEISEIDLKENSEEIIEDAEVIEEPTDSVADSVEAELEESPADKSDHDSTDNVISEPEPVAVAADPKPRGGLPLLLGGAVAAGLGYGVSYLTPDGWPIQSGVATETAVALEDQSSRIAAVEESVATVSTAVETAAGVDAVSAVETNLGEISGNLDTLGDTLTGLTDRLTELEDKVATLELRPSPVGTDPAALDEEIKSFRSELSGAIASAEAEIAEVRAAATEATAAAAAAAAEKQAEAERQERVALARAALVDVEAALESGEPMTEALSAFAEAAETEVPPALADVADEGVPALGALKSAFSADARSALAVSLREGADDSTSGKLSTFLRVQTGARSLTPREGDDPDAVLSRAEAAVAGNDLETAITEIASLPEAGQSAMADWVSAAETRVAAVAAAAELANSLNSN
jgi:hypothetical protein